LAKVGGHQVNLSVEPRLKVGPQGSELKPGYDGQVPIYPKSVKYEIDPLGNKVVKPRSSTVLHELIENYERTDNRLPYVFQIKGKPAPEYKSRPGAHQTAIDRVQGGDPSIVGYQPGDAIAGVKLVP